MEVSDQETDLIELTRGQAEQYARLDELWPEYGHALQVTAATGGGMGWRTVDGVEYLTRYTHEHGKKKGRSLGRRSPATEAQLAHFENTVLRARQILRDRRKDVTLTCRLAKAHGSARLHGRFSETLDWLWMADISHRVALFGGSALLAYENMAGVMAPTGLIKDDHLQFLARTDDTGKIGLEEIGEACGAEEGKVDISTGGKGRIILRCADRVIGEVFTPSFLLAEQDREQSEWLQDSLEKPWLKSLIVSRDCRPLEVTALDPRVYAVVANCLSEDPIWSARSNFAVKMVRARWPAGFDDDREAILDGSTSGRWGGP